MHCLGEFFDEKETIRKEFKEFRFSNIHNIDETFLREMITDPDWSKLLSLSRFTIEEYIKVYVPKYVTSFANTDIHSGILYIGVSDDGEKIGVPISPSDNLFAKNIDNMVKNVVYRTVMQQECKNKYDIYTTLLENTKTDIIPLDNRLDIMEDSTGLYLEKYNNMKKKYDMVNSIYVHTRKKWIAKLKYHRRAINIIINEPDYRKRLIEYIQQNTNNKNKHITTLMIHTLKQKKDILFRDGEIKRCKNDQNNMAYWITSYRDSILTHIKKEKPPHHGLIPPESPYKNIARYFRPLVKNMVSGGVLMAMIKITFPGRNKIRPHFPLLSYIDKLNKKKTSIRCMDSRGEPCCMLVQYV